MHKLVVAFSLMLLASPAMASEDIYPYVGVVVGSALTSVNKLSDASGSLNTDFDPGYMAAFSAGIALNMDLGMNIEKVRAEAEVGYRSSDLVRMKNTQGQSANMSGNVSVTNYMINCYFDNTSLLSNKMPVDVFISAGIGAATASISSVSYQGTVLVNSASDTQLAYQGGLGIGYELSKNAVLDTGYKYMGTTAFNLAGVKAEYASHNVVLGLRYSFK